MDDKWSFLKEVEGNTGISDSQTRTYKVYKPKSKEEQEFIQKSMRVLMGDEELGIGDSINWNADVTMAGMWFDEGRRIMFIWDEEETKVVFKY